MSSMSDEGSSLVHVDGRTELYLSKDEESEKQSTLVTGGSELFDE